ncbi:MAG: TetR/AcrR family transcriptional regulator [Phototrophicaceae bacterium]
MAAFDEIDLRILSTAKALFLHYGYDKTTINDIARDAGIAKSTLYTRWNKKEDLFDALIWYESKQYAETWIERVENDPNSGTYGGWMRHALSAFFENEFLRVLYKNDRRIIGNMLKRQGLENLFLQRIQVFMGFFKKMQDAGAVRQDIDPLTLTYLMNSLQYGLIHFVDIIPASHTPELDETLTMMVDMLDHYITPLDGVDNDAGKTVLREFMTTIRQMLDTYNT